MAIPEIYCQITVFDDGNEKYKNLPNVWQVVGSKETKLGMNTSGEKLALKNIKTGHEIKSISGWKLVQIEKS